MARESSGDPTSAAPAQRLRDALAKLRAGGHSEQPTAKALCEMASVSRNALYRYHSDILIELHRLQRRHQRTSDSSTIELQRLRTDNQNLREQVAMIAALVDHYFAAWQEGRTLLERRERELTELRRSLQPKLTAVRRK